jgi:hypothetical protein
VTRLGQIAFYGETGKEKKGTWVYESSGPTLRFKVTQPGTYWIAHTTDPIFPFLATLQAQSVRFGPSADFLDAEQVKVDFDVEKQALGDTVQASCTAPCRVSVSESEFAVLLVPIEENRRFKYAYIKKWEQSDAMLVMVEPPGAVLLHVSLIGGISPKPFGLRFAASFVRGEIIVAVEPN